MAVLAEFGCCDCGGGVDNERKTANFPRINSNSNKSCCGLPRLCFAKLLQNADRIKGISFNLEKYSKYYKF